MVEARWFIGIVHYAHFTKCFEWAVEGDDNYRDHHLQLPITRQAPLTHAWPGLVGFLLGTHKAADVWTFLPPKIRQQWRGLCVHVNHSTSL